MAQRPKETFKKRDKEKARREKQEEKTARRIQAKQSKAEHSSNTESEDPDIAGIRPGPQPLPDQWNHGIVRRD